MDEKYEALFVEDYSRDRDSIKLVVFDIKSFYDKMDEPLKKDGLSSESRHELFFDNYTKKFCSIEEDVFFKEITVPYELNRDLFETGFQEKFYSVQNGKLYSEYSNVPDDIEEDESYIVRDNPYVLRAINDFNRYFQSVEKDYEKKEIELKGNVYAAIVNVGFGNCCFIFDEQKTIAVDCSNRETCGKKYQPNVDAAIRWILNVQKKDVFHIDAFLLTHPHYDHYSGVIKMIKDEYVDRNTKFFINRYYRREYPPYAKIFAYLSEAGIKYTHSTVCNSIKGFEILYPKHSRKKYQNVNNSSVIVSVSVGNEKFVIPGDIESGFSTEGWDDVSLKVKKKVQQAAYYMLSHHGSQNGFCFQIVPQKKKASSFCSTRRRHNYHGVPHKKTLRFFKHLYKTNRSRNVHYIEVDFSNKTVKYR